MKCHRQCVCLLLQVISFVANCLAENLILNVNFKKPIAVTDHAFLSFALDPATLQDNDFIKNIERSTNLARGLVPAYIRLGGPQSNFYNFEQVYSHEIDMDPNDMHFGKQWTLMYQWAKNAGLDVVACITPHYIGNELNSSDPKNIAELLSFSDRMGYNVSWQLGYECQTRCDLSGRELGQYVANLREMLKTFPRYANSLITGPDIVAYRTAQQQKYLQDYLHSANTALSAITWHPNLDNVSLNNDNISIHYDNMIAEKDELYKIINSAAGKTPLWIVESKPQESKYQYLRALIWTKRLGDAAKLGVQVVMRQLSDLTQATPVYWVSLLHKTLVDRKVLEIKLQSDNENHVYFYSQCAKPSMLYSNGAITIFGINLTPKKVTASLKDLKIKILHQYILSPDFETDNKMFSEKVLLNNKTLNLINDTKLPEINPEIIINSDGLELELPSDGIGFWVIPNAKVEACISSEEEIIKNGAVKKLSKRHEGVIQQDNQEHEEKDVNVEDDVKENKSQSNLKIRKIYRKRDQKKQKSVENTQTESQEEVWKPKLLERIKKLVQNKLQKKNKNKLPNLQRSFSVYLGEDQENSTEEVEEQNLNKKVTEDDPFKNIQDTVKKFKYILLKKKAKMEIKSTEDHQSEVQNIDNILALISKIDALLLNKDTSNEPIMNEVKDKVKNGDKSIIKINNKLNEYSIELENSEIKANVIKKIEKYYNTLYNLLEDNNSKKNSQVNINDDLMEKKRFKRHLDRNLKDSKKITILKKRSQINDLKNCVKKKIKQKKDDLKKGRGKLISSYYSGNSQKIFNDNKNKYNNLSQRDPVKRLFKSNAFENAARHIDRQNLIQDRNRIENDVYKNTQYSKKSMLDHPKHSKISITDKYQSLIEPGRMKRDINKKFVDIGVHLKRESAFRKRSRDLKNYLNERKTRQKDDSKKEGFVVPFNPKTTDSDENNFYGFFRQDPVKGFPEGDIFVTTGDSLEQKEKDYDYVEDEDDSDNIAKKKNTQHSQKSTLDYTRDNTWIEEVEDQSKHKPNEFFENIKLSNTIKENFKNYDDLWEAEFSEQHDNNNNNNNNNEFTVAASKPFDQLPKIPISSINHQASNAGFKETNLKMEPELKPSNSFYLPSQDSTTKDNYDNYQISSINYDKLKEENSYVMSIKNRDHINAKSTQYSKPTSVYTEHSIRDELFHNKRNKRSNWENLRKIFAEEMIKEDEENARDCHCRVIRATDSPKKLHQRRVKYNSVPTAQITDTSSENKSVSADVKEYEEIIEGEILPNAIIIDNEENDTSMESVITELNVIDHKLSDTTQATNRSPLDSTSQASLNDNNSVKTFFRGQSSDVESENKTKTYDSSQVISTISSEDKNDQKDLIFSIARKTLETTNENVRDPTIEKKKTDSTTYPTTTEDQKNKKGHNNDYKIELKSTNSLKETTEAIAEQATTETILLQQAESTTIDNSKLDESKTKSKLRNIEDNQTNKSKARMQLEKDANARKIKIISQNLPRASLERLIKYEGRLLRRAEQIDKLKEKLYARRKELLHQYQNELMTIGDEQKRNLRKREAWERLHKSDDYYQLINEEEFIRILLNNDITYEEDNKSYLIPIKLAPKQSDEKITNDDTKTEELGKKITWARRDVRKQTGERLKQLPYNCRLSKDVRNKLDSMDIRLNKNFLKKIFTKDPETIILLPKIKSPSADLFRKSKNYLVSSRKDFEVSEENEQEHEANYIALLPIKIKNIYKMLDVKDNDDSLESSEIPARWGAQYVLGKMPGSTNKYFGDETLEEFEYEDLSTLLSLDDETLEDFEYEELSTLSSENNESIPDEESSYENEQDISVEDSEVESKKDEQYKITNDKSDNKSGIFVLLPSKNVKERQRRQIKNEIDEGTDETRCEVTRQTEPNKFILAEDLENKRNKRYYLNNVINKEEENMIKTNDIRVNSLQPRINQKNRDNLLEEFIKAQKKNNLYNNEALSVKNEEKNESTPLNNVSKSDEQLLQEATPKLQNYVESLENSSINDSEENFNSTLATNKDKHHNNRISENNVFYTAIMNIKNFFTFFSKLF